MGTYTDPNFRCSTCGHFVANHGWDDARTDEEKAAGAAHDNEKTRGACHACACKDYVNSGSDIEVGSAEAGSKASAEIAVLQAKVDAARKAKLEAELKSLTGGGN